MDTRRDFLKKASMLSAASLTHVLPESIQRALAINPAIGSTFNDAEHVVILMQENRSFDHCYGTLQGVRGFDDPRAVTLPDKNSVFLQTNAAGETYAPFRLNIKDTKATWMGSLPHSWTDQVDARNHGKHDHWLIAKRPGNPDYRQMPLTLGHYTREDIPFYYSLADAFTVCDQNFCSSLTGTTPNRLYLWTGTIREEASTKAYANVRNENLDYDKPANWKTFPERLEENGISWRIYQNELSLDVGFEGEEDSWLANFTDNPIEWFTQYHVKFSPAYTAFLPKKIEWLSKEIGALEGKIKQASGDTAAAEKLDRSLREATEELAVSKLDLITYTPENFEKLPAREKRLHEKAFTTNKNDPDFHRLATHKYNDGDIEREVPVPAGDVLHQFRQDVTTGKLPTVSWLVAPENFSDHPGAPWYGAWYVSEVMDILTKDPEVWKKTIFILCYDENDGYFDHVPPFTVPTPGDSNSGATSSNIDTSIEYVTVEQDKVRKAEKDCRESPIGLGYRVPLVIASPWNRGGMVCSQVFDHTSVLQFLEKFLTQKTGKKIEESNITAWRRSICGDLTATFKPYNGEKISLPESLAKNEFIEGVHKAQFKRNPSGYRKLTTTETELINRDPATSSLMPRQEKGTRTSCALPYELYADGVSNDGIFTITFKAGQEFFGSRAAGAPFHVYAPGMYKAPGSATAEAGKTWPFAVRAGDTVTYSNWKLADFENGRYHLRVHGPNGFFREFRGATSDPGVEITCGYERDGSKKATGNIELLVYNSGTTPRTLEIKDETYRQKARTLVVAGKKKVSVVLNLSKSFNWYDFALTINGSPDFSRRLSGKVETGKAGLTDPAIGMTTL